MSENEIDTKTSEFIERFGLLWERLGANRSVGRMLAWLTICQPAEQTADEIRDAIRMSQASISNATRSLESSGMIERVSLPGKRRTFYRIPRNAWLATARKNRQELGEFVEAARLGKEAVSRGQRSDHGRIDGLIEWATWWQARYGQLLDEWDKR